MSRTVSPVSIRRPDGQYEITGASIVVEQDGDCFVVEIENVQTLVAEIATNAIGTREK